MSQVTTRREKVAELLRRSIVGKRSTRARINLGIMLIAKPDGKYRFIWNGKPLSPYLTKTDFSYELLSRFLEGVLDGSELGKLDLVDGFFALKIKPSQRQYLGFSLENELRRGSGILRILGSASRYYYCSVHILPFHLSHNYLSEEDDAMGDIHHLLRRSWMGDTP